MKHYGDITKIKGSDVPIVDIVTGGSPCQDLSVAGKRAGLDGERSGLFLEQIRIVKEMRDECRLRMRGADENGRIIPRFMVWENVPGAFSSNKGEDFRCVLEEVCRVADKDATVPMPKKGKWSSSGCIMGDGYSVAWRVCDAQFWGVPQRRKRIALVADFGGQTAPEILFERKGVFGDIESCGKERKETAGDTGKSVESTSGALSFQERAGKPGGGKGILIQNERIGALSTVNNQSVAYGFKPQQGAKAQGMGYQEEIAPTLNTSMNAGVMCLNDQGGFNIVTASKASFMTNADDGDVAQTLVATDYKDPQIVVYGLDRASATNDMLVANNYIVRRLTPLECERLQGFPDNWTNIGDWVDSKGKTHKGESDSPRYKALGNSIALPFWEWMAARMVKALKEDGTEHKHPTMASLFDGIGGFPLVFSRCGCEPVWASEIEEFPIAVTKIRFPEESNHGEKG